MGAGILDPKPRAQLERLGNRHTIFQIVFQNLKLFAVSTFDGKRHEDAQEEKEKEKEKGKDTLKMHKKKRRRRKTMKMHRKRRRGDK